MVKNQVSDALEALVDKFERNKSSYLDSSNIEEQVRLVESGTPSDSSSACVSRFPLFGKCQSQWTMSFVTIREIRLFSAGPLVLKR